MKNVSITFNILEEGKHLSLMHSYMPCHMIFDVKMELTRKARYVDTGCHAPKSDDIRYAGVVSRESVCTSLTCTTINVIDTIAAHI